MPDARARAHFLMRASEGIPEELMAEMRQMSRETLARQDAERTGACKGRKGGTVST
jgi:hypothetical protein